MTPFEEVKNSINDALEEIKKQAPELYSYLKENILMDERNCTFMYKPKEHKHE